MGAASLNLVAYSPHALGLMTNIHLLPLSFHITSCRGATWLPIPLNSFVRANMGLWDEEEWD